MTDKLYTQNGRILVADGALKCGCCGGGDDPDPPWVCPDCPDWGGPGGPEPPSNPDGNPRCCTGNTICSPTNDEPILLGVRLTGTISNQYSYGTGPNAGVVRSYSGDFNDVFITEGNSSGCEISDTASSNIFVDFYDESSSVPTLREIRLRFVNLRWTRTRGFYGNFSDDGDDPSGDISSGVLLEAGGSRPIRAATDINGYDFNARICRSDDDPVSGFPSLPPVPRPNTFSFQGGVSGIPVDEGTDGTTSPTLACLNKVVYEFNRSFQITNDSGDSDNISIVFRFYAFVARIAPCPLTV